MAPEIMESKNQTKSVDIWSLGILLYELVIGHSPFKGKNVIQIYKNIKKKNIKLKRDMDPHVVCLLLQMLRNEPEK